MAHLLPPAGITYPQSDTFRNYLVRPPAPKQRSKEMVICCEMPVRAGSECRKQVRCQLRDGYKTVPIKVCPDLSDALTNYCKENDCTPRPPLTQPGLLCYSSCSESCPRPETRNCKPFFSPRTCPQPCPPRRPPCPKRSFTSCPMACPKPTPCDPMPCPKPTPCNPMPCPCADTYPQQRGRPCSAGDIRPKPRLVQERITTHCYTYEY